MAEQPFGDITVADLIDTDSPDPFAVLEWLLRRGLIDEHGRVPDRRRMVGELLEHLRREGR